MRDAIDKQSMVPELKSQANLLLRARSLIMIITLSNRHAVTKEIPQTYTYTISEKIVNTLPLEWQYSGIAHQLYSLLSTLLLMYNVSLIVLHHSTTLTGGRGCCSELQFNFSTPFLHTSLEVAQWMLCQLILS